MEYTNYLQFNFFRTYRAFIQVILLEMAPAFLYNDIAPLKLISDASRSSGKHL